MQSRSIKNNTIDYEDNHDFLQDLEQALLQNDKPTMCGIDEFQKVYKKKKQINETIDLCRRENQNARQNIKKAHQRIFQIQQLNDRAIKQTVLMKNQMDKIHDAHLMSKILMMEKIVRLQKEAEEYEKKKDKIFQMRSQKFQNSLRNMSFNHVIGQRKRQISMMEQKNLRQYMEQRRQQNYEEKRKVADRIKQQKDRLKSRMRKIEQFKIERARKNYLEKTDNLRQVIRKKQKTFQQMYGQQQLQEKFFETTKKITKQYIQGLFPTETI